MSVASRKRAKERYLERNKDVPKTKCRDCGKMTPNYHFIGGEPLCKRCQRICTSYYK